VVALLFLFENSKDFKVGGRLAGGWLAGWLALTDNNATS
jgi:hypothetical protein